MPLPPGKQIDRYEIRAFIGAGAMGEVYLAQDSKLKRPIALKILPSEFAANQQRMNRFLQEARLASLLNHPHAIHIYEIGESAGVHFIAMEYVKGETLRARLKRGPMKLSEILDLVCQIGSALVAAHQAGIVHRDIKTENVMLTTDGYAKVLDFGLAKSVLTLASGDTDAQGETVSEINTAAGVVIGTANYMSPEQARGLPVDERTDVWSLAVVLYEMVTGRTPFEAEAVNDVIASILRQEPAPLSRYSRDTPEALEWIVTKALTKDRDERYQTVKELIIDLQRLRQRLESGASGKWTTSSGSEIVNEGFSRTTSDRSQANQSTTTRASSAEYLIGRIKQHRKGATVVLLSAGLLIAVAVVWFLLRPGVQRESTHRDLVRLTFDSGLQCGPTWSPDGRFIAYASDRKGNFDIWVQQTVGGNPVQVTTSAAHDWQPDWSPDGQSIVFRSEREGGGLFIVPAFGGTERKISSFGDRPRWSPDGSKVLFLSAGQRIYDYPRVYVWSLNEPVPREIHTLVGKNKEEGVQRKAVAWYPDGQRISLLAMDGTFWTIPINGGLGVKSEWSPAVEQQFKQVDLQITGFVWNDTGKTLYFEGRSKGVLNLWKVQVDTATLQWTDGLERLTTGVTQDTEIALSRDGKHLAFVSSTQSARIWLLPFDANTGQLKGNGEPITGADSDAWFVDLSPDGKKLVYASHKYGMDKQQLSIKTLADGRETLLADDRYYRYFPRWSPDNKRLAYSRFQSLVEQSGATPPKGTAKSGPIVMLDPADGQEQFLTSPGASIDYMSDWSSDGRFILASTNRNSPDTWAIELFPLSAAPHAETEMRVIAALDGSSLWQSRFSPQGDHVSFVAQKNVSANASVIYLVPLAGGTPAAITDPNSWSDWPRWSPNGQIIYFVWNHNSSFINVYGIRLDPKTARPLGEPFRVTNYESPSRMVSTNLANMEMALTKSSLALPIVDVSGSIWMLDSIDE